MLLCLHNIKEIPRQHWYPMDIHAYNIHVYNIHCKACGEDFKGGLSAVRKHNGSKKHQANLNSVKKMLNIFSFPKIMKYQSTEKLSKEIEIKIAAFVAEHNIPFNVSDHLTDLIKSIPPDGEVIKKISCDRTKCSAIVSNVLGLQAKQDLIENIRNNFFSIIIY